MFVVEERFPNDNPNKIEYDELVVFNDAGKALEIRKNS